MSLEQIATLVAIAGGFVTIWWRLQQAIAETARFRATMEERLRGIDKRLESLGDRVEKLNARVDEHARDSTEARKDLQAHMSAFGERIARIEALESGQ